MADSGTCLPSAMPQLCLLMDGMMFFAGGPKADLSSINIATLTPKNDRR
jgi:hypothetical protein